MPITPNADLLSLVKGKRVALVGPAPYLAEHEVGSLIDNYDIVCRMNDIIPAPSLQEHYGSRTDILFHNLGSATIPGLKRKIAAAPAAFAQLKMVVCGAIKAKHTDTDYLTWSDEHISEVVQNFKEVDAHGVPFYWIGVRDYKKIHSDIGVEFNTGTAAFRILLEHGVQELFMTGFTFYLHGDRQEELYYDGHWDKEESAGKKHFGLGTGHGLHAQLTQIEYFATLLQEYHQVLKIDSYLEDCLRVDNYPNVLAL